MIPTCAAGGQRWQWGLGPRNPLYPNRLRYKGRREGESSITWSLAAPPERLGIKRARGRELEEDIGSPTTCGGASTNPMVEHMAHAHSNTSARARIFAPQTRTYTRFLGVQIKLKKGALRYTDVPGVAVTPVLGGERDLAGQVRSCAW